MAKRVKIWLAVLLIAVAGVAAWQALLPHEREPTYKGKPLSQWLAPYTPERLWGIMNYEDVWEKREGIVRHVGTNAIPTLLRMLQAKDSAATAALVRLAQKQHVIEIRFVPAYVRNYAAERGFKALGAEGRSAVPAVLKIAQQNISPDSQRSAINALRYLGPAAKEAVPVLLGWATNQTFCFRCNAILALGSIGSEPVRVIPVLTNFLNDPVAVRASAISALGSFGTNTRVMMPMLAQFLSDPDNNVRIVTTNALKAIDPETAAKAGVK